MVVDSHAEVSQVKLGRSNFVCNIGRPVNVIGDEFLVPGPLHPLNNVFEPSLSCAGGEKHNWVANNFSQLGQVEWIVDTDVRCDYCKLIGPIFTVK